MTTRRTFISLSAGAIASAPLLGISASAAASKIEPAAQPLNILFLGGTGFIGPHQINYALARGHKVTMFNRGSNPGMYGDAVEELIGDRDDNVGEGLNALRGDRTWDVVIDNSGYVPRHVIDSATLLKDRCNRYLYVSTVAVYDFDSGSVFDENSKMATMADPSIEEVTGETYGPLKADSEMAVREIIGERCTVVRPTYVVGPGDHTDRFTYWVDRVCQGGDVLAPATPDMDLQWVDVRDLCPWIITLAENNTPGIFNAAGPTSPSTRGGLVWGIRAITEAPVEFYWPSEELLEELEINQPLMGRASTAQFVNSASINAGLNYRSLADTAQGTLQWWNEQTEERRANARRWPTAEQEAAAIARLKR